MRLPVALGRLLALSLLAITLAACRAAGGVAQPAVLPSPPPSAVTVVTSTPPPAAAEPTATGVEPVTTPDHATPTPFYSGPLSAPCGVILPPLPPQPGTVATPDARGAPDDAARGNLLALSPTAARPALQRLLDTPGAVGLVAFQVGREAEGVYLNPDVPMPLASVAKINILVAYAEAVAAGELNTLEPVALAELDRHYLPNFDLGAHRRAVAELREEGRLLGVAPDESVLLEDVAWMMIRHSSNAAADYLHLRLGQARIEETAAALGLNTAPATQSAPCTFLGQFLMMGNHTRGVANDRALLAALIDDPSGAASYGAEVALLADAYVNDAAFRAAEQAWRARTRGPSIDTQRFFAARLAPQGTAGAYAALMSRLAQNGLSNADSSFQARRILEWPNQFEANQELFSNVGYKNGALPGVLTTAYYAYRWNDLAPVVVVLFFRDLPQATYRDWRFDLPHDELARWLLADPAAIPALAAALGQMNTP